MFDWKKYWCDRPKQFNPEDYFEQVWRTVGGKPNSGEEFDIVVESIVNELEIDAEDTVLDLCCGNGLITSIIAKRCREIAGLDYSDPLLDIARNHQNAENIHYVLGDVCDTNPSLFALKSAFSKVFMCESLHYLDGKGFNRMLGGIRSVSTPAVRIRFDGVPDRAKIDVFYDTPERKAERLRRKTEEGYDIMGYWWDKAELSEIAAEHGFATQYHEQDSRLNTAHYRFDVLLQSS